MQSSALEDVDVLVATVIPETELRALLVTFGIDPAADHDVSIEENYLWLTDIENSRYGSLSVAIACLPDQGVLAAQTDTLALLGSTSPLSPDLALLVGTAGGRGNSSNGDLVVSTDGIVYYEPQSDDVRPQWAYPSRALQRELTIQFDEPRVQNLGLLDRYADTLDALADSALEFDISTAARDVDPALNYKAIASGEKILDETRLEDIAQGKGQVRAAEKEGFGFAQACDSESCEWMVIRSISDRGDRAERKAWALPAAAMAAAFAHLYVEHADVPFDHSDEDPEVEPDSLYSRKKIPDLMAEYLSREYDIDISAVDFDLELTITDLERLCEIAHPDLSTATIRDALREARSSAYEEKYGNRSTDEDERFAVMGFENWQREFRDVLTDAGITRMRGDDVLVVGVGSGHEIDAFYSGTDSITGVDLSAKMLDQARDRHPELTTYQRNAEDLDCLDAGSRDIYVSLRTYQSTLLDSKAAMFEAGRVLRPGGTIVLSVPYIFYNQERDEVVQGLLRSPESDKLDPNLPYEVADEIRRALERFMFENVKVRTGDVEIYVYGERR